MEHIGRFARADRPNYANAALKVLLIIGNEQLVTSRMKTTQSVPGVAVAGMIVSPAYDSYNMLVRHAGEAEIKGPFFLVCDSVAKTLKENRKRQFESVQSYRKRRMQVG